MPARWYRAYLARGYRDGYVDRVSNLVRRNCLSDTIPCLCVERRSRRRGVGEFYLFIGINTDEKGWMPERIELLLGSVALGHPIGDFGFEEIRRMVAAEIDTTDYVRTLPYRPPPMTPAEDPLDLHELEASIEQPTDELAWALNHLLFWVSSRGSGTWRTFKNACDKLVGDTIGVNARHIFRRLRLLGHVEYASRNGSRWSACPPALAQTSSGGTYFLAGQRTPELIRVLGELMTVEDVFQPTYEAPNCIQVNLTSAQDVQTLAEHSEIRRICQLRWAGCASERLATILPDLASYRAGLALVSGFVVSSYATQKWSGREFVRCHFEHDTGMYQLIPRDPNSPSPRQTLFFDAEHDCWRAGDWYGLRYLAQEQVGDICQVRYQPNQKCLILPADYRWPDLYERALVLASGFLPLKRDEWLYFGGISPDLANNLSRKLNATVEETY